MNNLKRGIYPYLTLGFCLALYGFWKDNYPLPCELIPFKLLKRVGIRKFIKKIGSKVSSVLFIVLPIPSSSMPSHATPHLILLVLK